MIAATLIGLAIAAAPIPPTPATDDGPCPEGTYAWLDEFSSATVIDYHDDTWTVDGVVVGYSLEEDACIVRATTDDGWVLYGTEAECDATGGYWWYEACGYALPVTA